MTLSLQEVNYQSDWAENRSEIQTLRNFKKTKQVPKKQRRHQNIYNMTLIIKEPTQTETKPIRLIHTSWSINNKTEKIKIQSEWLITVNHDLLEN